MKGEPARDIRWVRGAVLGLAQGLGTGRLPWAPGTWGSLLGLLWWTLLLATGSMAVYVAGMLILVGLSVPVCGYAEREMGTRDPGSVVLDEIVGLPICYLGWCGMDWIRGLGLPGVGAAWTGTGLGLTLGGFVLFRLFDALKPGPIGWVQEWPAGWGIVADDVLAAVFTSAVLGLARWWYV